MKTICDYMILQRDAGGIGRGVFAGTLGEAETGVVVARVVREDDNTMVVPWQVCEQNGKEWHIALEIPQGGLYRVEARRADALMSAGHNNYDWAALIACASHVGVGDIFVLAGQSNMSGYGKDPAYDPPQLGVHLFNNAGRWVLAAHPLGCVPDPVFPNNDSSSGTSPGLAFGKMMERRLHVPIGLVSAALGGSALESWNPAEEDCFLFRSMEEKLECVGGLAGMIWYQGCNETGEEEEAASYLEKFSQSISLWRERFGHFPIGVCQINRHSWKGGGNDRFWGLVREAQRQAGIRLRDVFVVPTLDLYTSDGIHNASGANIVIGERLASAMLRGAYAQPGSFAPSVKRITKIDARSVKLEFYEEQMLRTMDDLACGMNIEDENGMMRCEKVLACPDGAIVTGEREIGANAVFHAYWEREEPAFFLRDIYGMPMLACFNVPIEG